VNFILFTQHYNNEPVLINFDKVADICPLPNAVNGPATRLSYSGMENDFIVVSETFDEIIKAIILQYKLESAL